MVAPVPIVSSSGCACTSSSRRSAGAVTRQTYRWPIRPARRAAASSAGDSVTGDTGVLGRGDVGPHLREVAGGEVARRLRLQQRDLAAAALLVGLGQHRAVLRAAGVEHAA